MHPANPVSAASHPDPYPYYATLQSGPPLPFDPALNVWVASRATVVHAVLTHPDCRVRPVAEAVPAALQGSSAGAVFGQLARMNDGAAHQRPKRALQQALATLDMDQVAGRTAMLSAVLAGPRGLADGAALSAWMNRLPLYVVADLLGFTQDELAEVASWVGDFVAGIGPLSNATQCAAASAAADALLHRFSALARHAVARPDSLLCAVQRQAALEGWDDQHALLANLLGLLSQTLEASAGLIGNSVVALLQRPLWWSRLRQNPALAAPFVAEVSRHDAPVQNTRRFVARTCSVAGVTLQPGATILLLLGAAGRDPDALARADEFDPSRAQGEVPGFGHGRHACPGQTLALTIAATALRQLLRMPQVAGLNPDLAHLGWSYRPSVNGRLPQFFTR